MPFAWQSECGGDQRIKVKSLPLALPLLPHNGLEPVGLGWVAEKATKHHGVQRIRRGINWHRERERTGGTHRQVECQNHFFIVIGVAAGHKPQRNKQSVGQIDQVERDRDVLAWIGPQRMGIDSESFA